MNNTEKLAERGSKVIMNTYSRFPIAFDHGEGMYVWDMDGKKYLDFVAGIAVNSLGYSNPKLGKKIAEQSMKLIHVSNLYYTEPQIELAEMLCENSCFDKVFFCNSGAEANEAAFKLAKIYFYKKGEERYEIISLDHSFHGRTLATVAATGQKHYQDPYRPLTPGFKQVAPNSFEALEAAVTDKTAAIMIELVQGEAGVYPMDLEYAEKVRKLCDDKGILLIVDEVQTGMGRLGKLFAHDLYGIEPDIFTCAKALGGGVPIGAMCAKAEVAAAFEPGDHGTTFGGNPFATAAGLAVFDIYEKEKLVENCAEVGGYLKDRLAELADKYPDKITEVRGMGLLIGIELIPEIAGDVFKKLFEKKMLTSLCKGLTIRIAPPLNITRDEADIFVDTLDAVLAEI